MIENNLEFVSKNPIIIHHWFYPGLSLDVFLRGGDDSRHHLLTDVVPVESWLSKGQGMRQRISRKARKRHRVFFRFLSYKTVVTLHIAISPHLASPVGEGQLLLLLIND